MRLSIDNIRIGRDKMCWQASPRYPSPSHVSMETDLANEQVVNTVGQTQKTARLPKTPAPRRGETTSVAMEQTEPLIMSRTSLFNTSSIEIRASRCIRGYRVESGVWMRADCKTSTKVLSVLPIATARWTICSENTPGRNRAAALRFSRPVARKT